MPIILKHTCGKKLVIDVDMAEKTGTCPQCKGTIVIPEKHTLIKLIQRARSAHLHRKEDEELGANTPGLAQAETEIHDEPAAQIEIEPLPTSEDVMKVFEFSDDELLMDPDAIAPETPPAASKCPSCGADVMPDAVICINCGTNLQTGEQLQTEAAEEPDAEDDEPDNQPDEGIERR